MKAFPKLFTTSLGKKIIMALTGAALFVFVIGHLLGNLQIFAGDDGEAINAYGHFLKSKPGLLWGARLGLLFVVGLHIWAAAKVSAENRAARPTPYAGNPAPPAACYASRTMLMSGLIIAAFIVYHLLHFTVHTQAINLTGHDFGGFLDRHGRHDVRLMMLVGFSHPAVTAFYLVAVSLLCFHLSHGLSALFQSLGIRTPAYARAIDEFARAMAWILLLGYSSIPISIYLGLIQ